MSYIGNKPTAVPLTSADLADNIISTAKIQDNAVTAAKYVEAPSFRNLIINGDMSVAQRGTSQANAGSSVGEYQTIDRYKLSQGGLGAFTWSQDTDVPTGQGFANSMKFDCTTADASPSANDFFIVSQILEGQMLQQIKKGTANAESLTLSFWVKSNKTGTYVAELFDNDNTRLIGLSYTINSSATWEKKTLTFVGDTTGTLNNDNDKSLSLNFWLGAGTTFTSGSLQTWGGNTPSNRAAGQVNLADSTANEWYITGVQLEVGTSASDFEFLPYDVNYQKCQRYYQDYGTFTMWTTALDGNTTTRLGGHIVFPTVMRTAPSVSRTNNTGTIDSENTRDRGYWVMAEKTNRGTTTNIKDMIFDAEL